MITIMLWLNRLYPSIQIKLEFCCCCVFLLSFIISLNIQQTSASCRPRFSSMVVHFENCIPTRVLARRCTGQCRPGVIQDEHDEDTHCCVPSRTVERQVRIYCPSSNGSRPRYVPVVKTVTLPIACGCEYCPPND